LSTNNILIEVKHLRKFFPISKGVFKRASVYVKAVDNIDLFIKEGETLGLVGESGCGKTTVGRTILRLIEPSSGKVLFRSKQLASPNESSKIVDIATATPKILRALRREMQIVFQDPYSSLNPRMSIADIIGEGMIIHGSAGWSEREDRVRELLMAVGLKPDQMRRYPHEFSGGQRQRIAIARALALNPQLVVADEPVSALDVSIQAQIINVLEDLQEKFQLTYLFISHDLSLVRYFCNRVAVMYLGKIVELTRTEELFLNPKHPYSGALMSAIPVPNPDFRGARIILTGDIPSPVNPPSGCTFHPRCKYVEDICKKNTPEYRDIGKEHFVACHFADKLHLKSIQP
jgi:peptide/nickel transport system ATP-binding protein